jgi:hypothetical protein
VMFGGQALTTKFVSSTRLRWGSWVRGSRFDHCNGCRGSRILNLRTATPAER